MRDLAHWRTVRDEDGTERREVDAAMYFRFAIFIAARYLKKFPRERYREEDVCGEAMVGLMRAVRLYDPSRGIKFMSYAGAAIWNEIMSVRIREATLCRACPTSMLTLDQPAMSTGVAIRDVIEARPSAVEHPLDAVNRSVDCRLRRLSKRHRWIIRMRFFDGLTYAEIAERIGVRSKQSVHKRLIAALQAMGMRGRKLGRKGRRMKRVRSRV